MTPHPPRSATWHGDPPIGPVIRTSWSVCVSRTSGTEAGQGGGEGGDRPGVRRTPQARRVRRTFATRLQPGDRAGSRTGGLRRPPARDPRHDRLAEAVRLRGKRPPVRPERPARVQPSVDYLGTAEDTAPGERTGRFRIGTDQPSSKLPDTAASPWKTLPPVGTSRTPGSTVRTQWTGLATGCGR